MKIYLAVEVYEDNNWFDGHNMLGAYLTPELALAAHQAEADGDDEDGSLWLEGEEVRPEDDEGDTWRWVIPIELELGSPALHLSFPDINPLAQLERSIKHATRTYTREGTGPDGIRYITTYNAT